MPGVLDPHAHDERRDHQHAQARRGSAHPLRRGAQQQAKRADDLEHRRQDAHLGHAVALELDRHRRRHQAMHAIHQEGGGRDQPDDEEGAHGSVVLVPRRMEGPNLYSRRHADL